MAKKILVVDDSMTARKLIKSALEGTGIEVLEAADGNQGIDMLMQNPDVRLIFSDINMPWKNGLEMIEEIKAGGKHNHIPICLLTTESSEDALESAKKLGITAFLVKPVQKEQITTLVETILA
jgi:two-component system, chemotaxis family, chemotaxis protein CheY